MNIAILQGRPTRDPVIEKSERTGRVYCRLRFACDKPYRGKDAPREADYFTVVCFGKTAQTVYNNVAKGALCTVLGRLTQSEYEDRTGNRRDEVSIIAQKVTIHEWLRKNRPLETLDSDFDDLVPREITKSLFKQIDIDDEDIPEDLMGRSVFDD